MKKMMLAAAMAVVTVAPLAAVTVGPEWCVAYPQEGSKEVRSTVVAASVYETDGVRVDPEGITCREQGEPVAEFPDVAVAWRVRMEGGVGCTFPEWYV